MTHYLSVIQRAVDALAPNTPEARAALYDRARGMLRKRFSPATVTLELASLDEAIELVEAETRRKRAPAGAARRLPRSSRSSRTRIFRC